MSVLDPDYYTGSVEVMAVLGDPPKPIALENPRADYELVNGRLPLKRVADDGDYAFYRPTDGLVYPMIQ